MSARHLAIATRTVPQMIQPILRRCGQESTVRPSLALYNTRADIDAQIVVVNRLASGRR